MGIWRTIAQTVPMVLAVSATLIAYPAFAQSSPQGQANPQGETRDLPGSGQSARDGQMVEDLIRRLQMPGTPAAPAPAELAPLQAPLPDTIAGPSSAPPVIGAPAVEPPATAAPPLAPSQLPLTGQLPITPAQIERMDALPNIDVEVLFRLDSAELTPRAFATLAILGRALADERLGKQIFLIAGHTDASGPPDHNLALSERRAQAVRAFLIERFELAPDRLLARGFGPERLKTPQSPGSRVNRRVQVVNWTSEAAPTSAAPAAPQRR